MKEEYILFNRSEIELILAEIHELEHDLREMLKKKKWVISETENYNIRLDFDFLRHSSNPSELFKISDLS